MGPGAAPGGPRKDPPPGAVAEGGPEPRKDWPAPAELADSGVVDEGVKGVCGPGDDVWPSG